MICTIRCCKWIINSLRSICCKEYSSLYIPLDSNETSAMARHAPTQYSSNSNFVILLGGLYRVIVIVYLLQLC